MNWIPEKDTLIELKSENLIHIGKVAKIRDRVSVIKFGLWKTYNEKRELLYEGEYKIGIYTYCDVVPSEHKYHYKTGIWKFYNMFDIPEEVALAFIPKNLKYLTDVKEQKYYLGYIHLLKKRIIYPKD